ncbi:hypothetical protein CJU89_3766 [Yarrowia sp. B02]|nr:hypothetical protein CJU89_3766 [Yarrowia sp. B02]
MPDIEELPLLEKEKDLPVPSEEPGPEPAGSLTFILFRGAAYIALGLILSHYLIQYFAPYFKTNVASDFRPAPTYTGDEYTTARVCVRTVPASESVAVHGRLSIADCVVELAYNMRCGSQVFLKKVKKEGWTKEKLRFLGKVHVTEARFKVNCRNCHHLITAAYQAFVHLDELPGVQCVAAQDSRGNTLSFVWGTDMAWCDDEDCPVALESCVYGENEGVCYEVGETMGVVG